MIERATKDRPREKLAHSGVSALGDNELLAVVLGHGTVRVNALEAADAMLTLGGGIHGLARTHLARLAALPGVGIAQACRVHAALELGRRTLATAEPERPQFLTPDDLGRYLLPLYGVHAVERFGVMLLDTRHRLMSARVLSTGTIDASLGHPREVFREALVSGASAVVAFHNHPSGDPTPSDDDVKLTMRLARAGQIVGVPLVDHVILGGTRFCSLLRGR
jgi:DNA repair protein RadC